MTALDSHIPATPRNIILVGIMGCGKTTVGREISRIHNLPMVDTDALIEEEAGMSISEIFARHGEDYFRELETKALRNLSSGTDTTVISTGGGIVIRAENRDLLRKLGYVVWLDAELDALFERIIRHTHRPLLHNDDPKGTLEKLITQRNPWYEETAHLNIDTTNLTVPEIVTGIIESSRVHFHRQEGPF